MPFEWFLALRFLREGRAQTLLILAGVAVGVGVIVFLSALITGLQATLVEQTLGSQAQVIVKPAEDEPRLLGVPPGAAVTVRREKARVRRELIDQWQSQLEAVAGVEGVVAATPVISGPAIASHGAALQAVTLNGVEPESFDEVIDISGKLLRGTFSLVGFQAVIGTALAEDLGVGLGEKLRLTAEEPSGEVFTVVGIFDLGTKEVNERWVFVSLRTGQTLLDAISGITAIDTRVDDVFAADEVARRIAARTGLQAEPWTELNKQLLTALQTQTASTLLIRFFVIVAVALGIASVLVVSVVQKSSEIGILKALGTSTRRVRRVFLIQGALVGLLGSALGSALGTTLALFFSRLAKNPTGAPTFPVALSPGLFALAALVATLTGLVAAVAPASRAAKLDPAKVIRRG